MATTPGELVERGIRQTAVSTHLEHTLYDFKTACCASAGDKDAVYSADEVKKHRTKETRMRVRARMHTTHTRTRDTHHTRHTHLKVYIEDKSINWCYH